MKLARGTLVVQQNQNEQLPRLATWGSYIQPIPTFQKTTVFCIAILVVQSFFSAHMLATYYQPKQWHVASTFEEPTSPRIRPEFLLQGYDHPIHLGWYKKVSDQQDTPQL